MKKETIHTVKEVASMTQDLSNLSVDTINEMAPAAVEKEIRLTTKQIAEMEGVAYITPKRQLQAFGKLPEKLKQQHARAWEYVKGIYENYVISGEPVEFWYCEYPGDPDCLWSIPCNVPVYIPRMIANHLEECQKYHTFSQIAQTAEPTPMKDNEVSSMKWFRPTGTHYRGKFRAVGSFR